MESNNPFMRNIITTHNITYGTLDFNVTLPPPYYREIWGYKNADTESIQKAISNFDWSKALRNKNANESCKLLTDILIFFEIIFPTKPKNSTTRPLSG